MRPHGLAVQNGRVEAAGFTQPCSTIGMVRLAKQKRMLPGPTVGFIKPAPAEQFENPDDYLAAHPILNALRGATFTLKFPHRAQGEHS